MRSPEIPIRFAGHQLLLDGRGVLYWPAERVLIASDLHLEKGSYFAQHGATLPPYDTLDTLERLEQCIGYYQPQRMVLLGDSFHDAGAWGRLDEMLRARVEALHRRVPFIHWVEGNHDAGLRTGHRLEPEVILSGILLTHDHAPEHPHQIIGHYHPKASMTLGKNKLRAPCFAVAPHMIILPAFGSYTGGLDISHAAIQTLAKNTPFQHYLLFNGAVCRL